MKRNTIWSVFLIASVSGYVDCIPAGDPGDGYKLEILSKDDRSSTPTTLSGSLISKLDFSHFYENVMQKLVPELLAKHEKGSTPGKETTHQLGRSVTESLTKSLSDVFNSKIGQEILIASVLKKRPTWYETLSKKILEYIKWAVTAPINKVHEIREKGLFGTHSHTSTSPPKIQHVPDTSSNGKLPQKQSTDEMILQPRDIIDRIEDVFRNRPPRGPYGGPYGRPNAPGPWNKLLYKPYDPNYPFSTMPPFKGRGPFDYFGYLLRSVFYAIQEFFSWIIGRPPIPPPGGRPTIIRRPPPEYYYNG